MSHSDDSTLLNCYQFPRWSTSITRPQSGLPSQNVNEMFKLGIDNRNQFEKRELSSKKRHIHIRRGSRVLSPPFLHQPTPTPDLCSVVDYPLPISSLTSPPYNLTPVRMKSAALTIPITTNSDEISLKNFPKQSHERRKIAQEKKRQRQQAQKYAETECDTWFQLRQSLVELKHLAATEEVLLDPTASPFNGDAFSFDALKQVINEQQQEEKKISRFISESGISSSFDSNRSLNNRSRLSIATSQSSLSRPRTTKQSTETYPRSIFEPLIIASKPLHVTGNNHPRRIKRNEPPLSAPSRVRSLRPSMSTLSSVERRAQFVISDLSINDDFPGSSTPSPSLEKVKEEVEVIQSESNNSPLTLSNIPLKSRIKLKSQVPRCRSAVDVKSSFCLNKHYPRFILITDQEHRIESWYHQYPFIVSDDLLQSFQSKGNQLTTLAYFIDTDQQLSRKPFLQGKPFDINNDWKKYDLIFISNNIYEEIIIHLQTIINLIKSSGKLIYIYQINHHEDLKTQIKFICKQLNQQLFSHV